MAFGAAMLLTLTTVAAGQSEIQISVVATRGSAHQPFGSETLAGAESAAVVINAAGGLLGRAVRVVSWSEDCTSARALQVAEEVVRLQPALVIGHLCANAALAAAPVYGKAGLLLIVPGVRHPKLTAAPIASPLLLRLAGRDDRFAAETVGFIVGHRPGGRVAIVADRTRQAGEMARGVAQEMMRQKLVQPHNERFESGEKSYDLLAGRVKASGAAVVLIPAQPVELGIVAAGLRKVGANALIVGSEILAVPEIEPTARHEAGNLVLMLPWTGLERAGMGHAFPALTTASRASSPAVNRAAAAVFARAAAALQVWAAAVQRTGTTDAAAIAAALRSGAAMTSVGMIGFDDRGDALVPSYVPHSWRDGGWVPLDLQQ